MEALINAGGKGSRMGACGIEKPMQEIGGKPVVMRVAEALGASGHIDRVLVSVSDNTLRTESYLRDHGIETIRTSGESFMDDIHESFKVMNGRFVLTCPSDLPLLSTERIDSFIGHFDGTCMQSLIALVDRETVGRLGISPSYVFSCDSREWVLSGISIMDREATLGGEYLSESYFPTDYVEFAVNVNTQKDLLLARNMFR